MNTLAILLGILATLLCVLLSLLFNFLFGISIDSFFLLFIIPIGALALGVIVGLGYSFGLLRQGVKNTGKDYLVTLTLGLATFTLIQVGIYQMTYVSTDFDVNYRFNGEHISNYQFIDSNETINFYSFLNYKLEISESQLRYRGVKLGDSIGLGSGYNTFKLVLEAMGFMLGSLGGGLLLTGSKIHCNACKKAYLQEYNLFETDEEGYSNMYDELNEIIRCRNSKGFIDFVINQRIVNKNFSTNDDQKMSFYIGHCRNCKEGLLVVKYYKRDKEDIFQEVSERRATVNLSCNIISDSLISFNVS